MFFLMDLLNAPTLHIETHTGHVFLDGSSKCANTNIETHTGHDLFAPTLDGSSKCANTNIETLNNIETHTGHVFLDGSKF